MRTLFVAVLLSGMALSGCARRVVLDPEVAAARNSKDWTVKGEPGKAAAAPAPQAQPAAKVPAAADSKPK